MNLPIVRAGIDLGTLIYLVIMVLWIFGKIFSKKGKSNGDKPARPRPAETTAEAELRDFLERMAGENPVEEEEEEIVEAPPPRIRRAPPPPARPVSNPVIAFEAPAPMANVSEPKPVTELTEVMKRDTPTHLGVGTAAAFASALRSTGSQFKLTESNISILKHAMRSSHQVPGHPIVSRNELKSKRMLKKALAAQVILGTPRAFETSDVPEAIRH